ncbi:MAG: hypothetical protein HYR91_04565 [Flavobacteriia bacterium]|nr:hypothetical protein [Flavobacteriia bacterium]
MFTQFELLAQDSLSLNFSHFFYSDFQRLDTTLKSKYPLVHFELNHFQFYTEESKNWSILYREMDSMMRLKDRKLNFYHIGGSHLQADIYTHDVRTKLQTTWDSLPGERAFVFPFDLAKTNNPSNYEFSSKNKWKAYRSVTAEKCELDYGLLGAVITCTDSIIDIRFNYDRTDVKPGVSKIRIFHNKLIMPYFIGFGNDEEKIIDYQTDSILGITEVTFNQELDSFNIQFCKNISGISTLQLSGFELMNQQPGISYTAIGINGAGLYTYLDCGNFEEQLRQSPPDFFAFSVGTNDGNVPFDAFNPQVYKANLEKMMQIVYRTNPNCAILLTVPNDSYYLKKYLNKNIAREREMIIELAKQYQVPIWDLYGIMGELGSSKKWQVAGLMQSDKVHFTGEGYHLKGSLYFDAFLKWMEQMKMLTSTELNQKN